MTAGAESLADYELLEMLLFLSVPRKDTKPMAKKLINYYGSLIDIFRAPTKELQALGLNNDIIRTLRLPAIAAERLSLAEKREKPVLGNWDALTGYLDVSLKNASPNQFRILYLDNRNKLLSDEAITEFNDHKTLNKTIGKQALSLHASAIIGVYFQPKITLPQLADISQQIKTALNFLSITTHDFLYAQDPNHYKSFQQENIL
ncbi:JAB domain-containing protein [Swingsia samuiensis]|nr:JAB domain-containing protein [Swingsia samuiensis]